jgi:hypothetical protein
MSFIDKFSLGSLSSSEKVRLAVAGAAAVGLITLAWWLGSKPGASGEKKNYGITVDDLCVSGVVTDPERLRRGLEDTYDTHVAAGKPDPFLMSQAFFAQIAPQCKIYPNVARSPKEAEFFLTVFVAFLEQLEDNNLITDDEARARMFEAMAWASRSGWQPTDDVDPLFGEDG